MQWLGHCLSGERKGKAHKRLSGTPQSPLPVSFVCVLGSFLCHLGGRPHGVFLFALPPTLVCGCMRAALAWWQLKAGSGYRVPTLGWGYARFRKRAFNSLIFTKPETEWHGARRTSWSLKCPPADVCLAAWLAGWSRRWGHHVSLDFLSMRGKNGISQ